MSASRSARCRGGLARGALPLFDAVPGQMGIATAGEVEGGGSLSKVILREAFAAVLPASVGLRAKKGFALPIDPKPGVVPPTG